LEGVPVKKLALPLLVAALAAGVACAADAQPPIAAAEIRETLEKLAGEEFLGREAGSEGGQKAGEWIAARCEKLGLKPAGDDGTYFQNFKASGRQMRNVVATLPAKEGSETADEVVVIGSHYDHLGKGGHGAMDFMSGGSDKVHYGADDNGSGSAGTLALARAFAAVGPAKRRIVFIWFDGEELGLFGSKHYVKKPSFPLKDTVCMFNMDMIGRLRKKLTVYGVNTGDTFASIEKRAAEAADFKIEVKDTMPPNSDHFSFYEKKVPVVALFTGLHKDYHRATDTVDKIDFEGMARVLRYGYRIVRGIADDAGRATFAQAKDGNAEAMFEQIMAMLDDEQITKLFGSEEGMEELFKSGGLPKVMEKLRGTGLFGGGRGQKPRFGVSTQDAEDGRGVIVSRVFEGSVAEKTGVKKGDRILSFDGKGVNDMGSLTQAIRDAKGKVKLVVERDGTESVLEAEFAPPADPHQPPSEPAKKRWF
jgi:hypothetical protein